MEWDDGGGVKKSKGGKRKNDLPLMREKCLKSKPIPLSLGVQAPFSFLFLLL